MCTLVCVIQDKSRCFRGVQHHSSLVAWWCAVCCGFLRQQPKNSLLWIHLAQFFPWHTVRTVMWMFWTYLFKNTRTHTSNRIPMIIPSVTPSPTVTKMPAKFMSAWVWMFVVKKCSFLIPEKNPKWNDWEDYFSTCCSLFQVRVQKMRTSGLPLNQSQKTVTTKVTWHGGKFKNHNDGFQFKVPHQTKTTDIDVLWGQGMMIIFQLVFGLVALCIERLQRLLFVIQLHAM